jgi:5-methylcytosine-specific restriction endonuclease McrA
MADRRAHRFVEPRAPKSGPTAAAKRAYAQARYHTHYKAKRAAERRVRGCSVRSVGNSKPRRLSPEEKATRLAARRALRGPKRQMTEAEMVAKSAYMKARYHTHYKARARAKADAARAVKEAAPGYRPKGSGRDPEKRKANKLKRADRIREQNRARYLRTKEQHAAYQREYTARKKPWLNPGQRASRIASRARNKAVRAEAMKRAGDRALTKLQVFAFMLSRRVCYYCGEETASSDKRLDHIVPLTRGGLHILENVAVACARCNMRKGNKTRDEFVVYHNRVYRTEWSTDVARF